MFKPYFSIPVGEEPECSTGMQVPSIPQMNSRLSGQWLLYISGKVDSPPLLISCLKITLSSSFPNREMDKEKLYSIPFYEFMIYF
jgi:hypothetical protein